MRAWSLSFPRHRRKPSVLSQRFPNHPRNVNPGDTITSHEGWQLHVDKVNEENGLLSYTGTRLDTQEANVTLREVLLDSKLVFSKPQDRLFAGQIDRMDRFALRYRARKFQSEQYRMPWSGLRGQRTSLIPHQLHIATMWAVVTRRASCWPMKWA